MNNQPAIVLEDVTAAELAASIVEIQKGGNTVSGQPSTGPGIVNYTITGHGITATLQYEEGRQVLTVTVIHKPFWMPYGAIEAGIHNEFKRVSFTDYPAESVVVEPEEARHPAATQVTIAAGISGNTVGTHGTQTAPVVKA